MYNIWYIPEMDISVNDMGLDHARQTFVKHAC